MSVIPSDFVSLKEVCSNIMIDLRYATKNNFTGNVVPGYFAQKALLTQDAARSLSFIQNECLKKNLTLIVFDAYRPVKAVEAFKKWATLPEINNDEKKRFYPHYERSELIQKGLIALRSSHSRGSAIDLSLYSLDFHQELDMGTEFDFFDIESSQSATKLTLTQKKNRELLIDFMSLGGFKNYPEEWWHFSLRPEKFPETYFDFDIL